VDREGLGVLSRYPAAPRRLLTVDECHRMGEAGILTEDDRVELPVADSYTAFARAGRSDTLTITAITGVLIPIATIFV
jgi:hypothetical protein